MDQHSYISLKAIILLILGLSAFARIFVLMIKSDLSKRVHKLFSIYFVELNFSTKNSLKNKTRKNEKLSSGFFYLLLSIEILLIGLVIGEIGVYLGGILAISYFLLPAIMLRYFAKCLPFNLFYRNLLIAFFSVALLFKFPEKNFQWMDYYSVTLLTLVAIGIYSVMNYILHQYNQDANFQMQTKL